MSIERLKEIVGPDGWIDDTESLQPHLTEWRGTWAGKTPLMLMPDSTEQVAAIIRHCGHTRTAIVPQGGNTGLCGGAIPDDSGSQILMSMSRMNRVRSVSPENFSICVEAGCVLADVQEAAQAVQRYFPLSLAAEGSCQIGGNLSTNAGGVGVLRYGTAREQVLGLEVVLADGSVWDGLRSLRKDTAGYDLKQLFIGAEGTLGIITAATLRLYPVPANLQTAWIAVDSPESAVRLLAFLRGSLADQLQAFELIPARAIRFVMRHIDQATVPGSEEHSWFVLLDAAVGDDIETLEHALLAASENDLLADVHVAKNQSEADSLWRLRHSISAAQKAEGASLKHDVSVPVDRIGEFIRECEAQVLQLVPGARVVAFGHVGDGNVHFNISQPQEMLAETFIARRSEIATSVYDVVTGFGGSISAEHGIGVLKREHLRQFRSPEEIRLMETLRHALDPVHILNPGKVL